jgi:hypothetical protein
LGEARLIVTLRVWDAAVPEGISLTATWRPDDLVLPTSTLRHKRSGWSIRSSAPKGSTLAEHLDNILARLPSTLSVEFGKDGDAALTVAAYEESGEWPELTVRSDQLARLAAIPAALDLDLYSEVPSGDIPQR